MLDYLAAAFFSILDPLMTLPANLVTQFIDYSQRVVRPTSQSDQNDPLPDCKYRLDAPDASTITLPDARKLSYAQFGSSSPTSRTVFFLHGWPGSRIEGTYLDEAAQRHDLRIVIVDRPGTGLSTPDPNRTLLSHAKDIEHLAEHLKAEQYGILGVSGGGPYALACAKALPTDKLKLVTIVCGLGPSDIGYWGMYLVNYLGWTYTSRYCPRFTQWWFSREAPARLDLSRQERLDMLRKTFENAKPNLPARDVRLAGDADVMKVGIRVGEEVFRQGPRWMMQDMKILASDPGFKVEDIRKDLKVQLWYGRNDYNVPLRHGEEIARRLMSRDETEDETQD